MHWSDVACNGQQARSLERSASSLGYRMVPFDGKGHLLMRPRQCSGSFCRTCCKEVGSKGGVAGKGKKEEGGVAGWGERQVGRGRLDFSSVYFTELLRGRQSRRKAAKKTPFGQTNVSVLTPSDPLLTSSCPQSAIIHDWRFAGLGIGEKLPFVALMTVDSQRGVRSYLGFLPLYNHVISTFSIQHSKAPLPKACLGILQHQPAAGRSKLPLTANFFPLKNKPERNKERKKKKA